MIEDVLFDHSLVFLEHLKHLLGCSFQVLLFLNEQVQIYSKSLLHYAK